MVRTFKVYVQPWSTWLCGTTQTWVTPLGPIWNATYANPRLTRIHKSQYTPFFCTAGLELQMKLAYSWPACAWWCNHGLRRATELFFTEWYHSPSEQQLGANSPTHGKRNIRFWKNPWEFSSREAPRKGTPLIPSADYEKKTGITKMKIVYRQYTV